MRFSVKSTTIEKLLLFRAKDKMHMPFPDMSELNPERIIRPKTSDGLLALLCESPDSMIIIIGGAAVQLPLLMQIYHIQPKAAVICINNVILPIDVSVAGYFRNMRILKQDCSAIRLRREAELTVAYARKGKNIVASDLIYRYEKADEQLVQLPNLIAEINERTHVMVMAEKMPVRLKRVLSLLLKEYSREIIAGTLKIGIRQVWLVEQALKQRWRLPSDYPIMKAIRIG